MLTSGKTEEVFWKNDWICPGDKTGLGRTNYIWLTAREVKLLVDMEVPEPSGSSVRWLGISWRDRRPCENKVVF